MSAVPLIILAAVLVGMFLFAQRRRQQVTAQEAKRRAAIGFGSQVMTTSGLYGTVTRIDADETVQLAIAPGIEVKWALAALRQVDSLPDRYKRASEPARADEPPEDNPRT